MIRGNENRLTQQHNGAARPRRSAAPPQPLTGHLDIRATDLPKFLTVRYCRHQVGTAIQSMLETLLARRLEPHQGNSERLLRGK